MRNNGEIAADFMLAAWALLKQLHWLVIAPPYVLWNSRSLSCDRYCVPTAGFFATIAVFLLILILFRLRSLIRQHSVRNFVWLVVLAGSYFGLPSLYHGMAVLEDQSQTDQLRRTQQLRTQARP